MVRFSAALVTLGIAAGLCTSPVSALAADPVTVNDPAAKATFAKLQSTLIGAPLLGVKAKYSSSDPDGANFTLDGTLNARANYFYGTMLFGTARLTLYATPARTIAKAPYKNCWKKTSSKLSLSALAALIFAPFDGDSWTGPGSPGPALFGTTGPNTLHWTVPGTTTSDADVVYDPATQRFLSTTVAQVLPATATTAAGTFGISASLKYTGVSTKRVKRPIFCR